MANIGSLVVIGEVTDIETRQGVSDNGAWKFVTAYIVGKREAFPVQLSDEMEGQIAVGDDVALEVQASIYRNRVQYEATRYYEPAAARGDWSADLATV